MTTPEPVGRGVDISATYTRRVLGDCELIASQAMVDELAAIISEHGTLYAWASEQPQPRAMRGRAPVYVATLGVAQVEVVVRHSWHGGFFAPLTGDRFLLPTRAPVELANSMQLRSAGIRTTELLGYALYPAGPGWRRIDMVSRLIPGASDLGAVLAELSPDLTTAEALPVVCALLKRLADERVVHPDLNVKNILLARDARRAIGAAVIDVDVVRFQPELPWSRVMHLNASRLLRSMRKWRTHFGANVSDLLLSEFERSCVATVTPDGA